MMPDLFPKGEIFLAPTKDEFMAGLAREKDKRVKERCVKRKAAGRQYCEYKKAIFDHQRRRHGS